MEAQRIVKPFRSGVWVFLSTFEGDLNSQHVISRLFTDSLSKEEFPKDSAFIGIDIIPVHPHIHTELLHTLLSIYTRYCVFDRDRRKDVEASHKMQSST